MTAPSGLSPEQVALRQAGIGASEIAAVAGLDPYKSALDVYLEKRGLADPVPDNRFTEWGRRLEPLIAQAYADRFQVEMANPQTTLRHPTAAWALCTPDRIVLLADPNDGVGLECKNRSAYLTSRWGEDGTDEVPHAVAVQCHFSMAVTGFQRWDVAVLLGGNDFRCYTIPRNEDIIARLLALGEEFWTKHVQGGIEPPLVGTDRTHDYLAKKYPLHSDEIVRAAADCAIADSVNLLMLHRREIKTHESALETCEVQIKDFIGARAGVELPNGNRVTWKQIKAGGVDYKGLATKLGATPDLITEFTRPGYRKLNIHDAGEE